MLALFVKGVSVQEVYVRGVYVLGGICPGGKCPGVHTREGDHNTTRVCTMANGVESLLIFIFFKSSLKPNVQ